MKKNRVYFSVTVSITALLQFAALSVAAASFTLKEQSVTNLGNAYAGTAAQADDASTAFYNAAGLTNLSNDQITASLIGMKARPKFTPNQARNNNGTDLALSNTEPKSRLLLPAFHVAKRRNDKVVFGVSVASQFGLKTVYNDTSVVRIMARRTELTTHELVPSIAYQIDPRWSVAVGANALRSELVLDADNVYNVAANNGSVQHRALGWGYGVHVGILFKPNDITRIGLQYRSRMHVQYNGDRTSSTNQVASATMTSKLKLPDILSYSIYHKYDDKWTMLGDLELTHWSVFREIRLNFGDATTPTTVIPQHYKNSMRVALGSNYHWSDKLTWKFGMAYDASPTRDNTRTARIPDSDRFWLSFGGKLEPSKQIALTFGYAHLFFKNAALNESAPLNAAGALSGNQTLKGTYKTNADIVGVQLTWNFV